MKKNNKKGFTLAELLIVIAIIAVLVAIAVPVFSSAVAKAEHAADVANVRAAYSEAVIEAMTSNDYDGGAITIDASAQAKIEAAAINGSDVTFAAGSITVVDGDYSEVIIVDTDISFG